MNKSLIIEVVFLFIVSGAIALAFEFGSIDVQASSNVVSNGCAVPTCTETATENKLPQLKMSISSSLFNAVEYLKSLLESVVDSIIGVLAMVFLSIGEILADRVLT